MAGRDFGSLTKELTLGDLDKTITAITPGQSYSSLLEFAREHTQSAAPGLISKRFILVRRDKTVAYDHFLSLIASYGIEAALVRKVMFFTWAYRDERLRRFICERVADKRGKWRVAQLTNKANADFFEEWLQEGPSRKARSNIEFFLGEAGIFNKTSGKIDLDLHDGWLHEAAIVAAQHEEDAQARVRLAEDPGSFLVNNGWMALANATAQELLALGASPIEEVPLEDEALTAEPERPSPTKEWNRRKPKSSDKKSTNALIDLVARERANQSHHLLEEITASAIKAEGFSPQYNEHIDMYFVSKALRGKRWVEARARSCFEPMISMVFRGFQVAENLSRLPA